MKTLARIALRGIQRNLRRSLVTLATVAVGVFVVLVIQGFLNGLHQGLIDSITRSRTGDLQVHAAGYGAAADSLPLKPSLDDADPRLLGLGADPRVRALSPRLGFAGMLSNGESSSMALALAVEPEAEAAVCPRLAENVAEGRYLRETPGAAAEALLASPLARALKVRPGDSLTLLANTRYGALNALDLQVVGLLTDRLPLGNNKLLVLPLRQARSFLQMPGKSSELALRLAEPGRAAAAAAALQASLGPAYEVQPWEALAKVFKDIMNIQKAVFWVVKAVLLVIVVSSILNTMLMSVYERVREIGTMMAIGMVRARILGLFVLETLALGALGGLLGLGLAGALLAWYHRRGFTYLAPGTSFPLTIYPSVGWVDLGLAFHFALLAGLLSSLYPAAKACRLTPTQALRST